MQKCPQGKKTIDELNYPRKFDQLRLQNLYGQDRKIIIILSNSQCFHILNHSATQSLYVISKQSTNIFPKTLIVSKKKQKRGINYPNRPVFQALPCLVLPPIREILTKSSLVKTASLYANSAGPCHCASVGESRESTPWVRRSRQRRTVVAPASSAF